MIVMTKISGALLLCATTVLVPAGLLADNGARATAHIIEGITVDGLFGDWPEGLDCL